MRALALGLMALCATTAAAASERPESLEISGMWKPKATGDFIAAPFLVISDDTLQFVHPGLATLSIEQIRSWRVREGVTYLTVASGLTYTFRKSGADDLCLVGTMSVDRTRSAHPLRCFTRST